MVFQGLSLSFKIAKRGREQCVPARSEGVIAEEQSRNGKAEALVAFHQLGLFTGAALFYLTFCETAQFQTHKSNILKSIFEMNININNFFN